MSNNETIISVALTPRHGCPADSNIWPENVDNVLDFEAHFKRAGEWLTNHVVLKDGELRDHEHRVTEVRLYITGLTSLTVAFLNAWTLVYSSKLSLMLMHWDRSVKR
jgi:hypothetical protein